MSANYADGIAMISDNATTSPRLCRICGSNLGRYFAVNGFHWIYCATCRTTQKILTRQQYLDLNPTYDPGAYLDSRDRGEVEKFLDIDAATAVITDAVHEYIGDITRLAHRPQFLDVGCGMGRYLIAAERLGFDVLGFEPSANHARVAIEHYHLPVIPNYFELNRVPCKHFDMIMLSHVIEHIYDPKNLVHDLVRVLRPGGVLIVITPNNESLAARIIGKAWPMLKPVDHVSMIGETAYEHFQLVGLADVFHRTSEYPFEFAASALAAVKSYISIARRGRSSHQTSIADAAPPPLRGFSMKAKLLRYALSLLSAPMYAAAIATRRQACLVTAIVRQAQIDGSLKEPRARADP